jgi:aminopeptidase N
VPIGDPGPELLFDFAVYIRGAMTLHELRLEIGDQDFFRLARRWTQVNSGQLVTTDEFIRLAERVSGEQIDDLFETWLFSPEQPSIGSTAELREAPSGASLEMHRLRVMDAHRRR